MRTEGSSKNREDTRSTNQRNTLHRVSPLPQNIKVAKSGPYYLPKFSKEGIKTKPHREIPHNAILKQATISRQNNQYFVSILIDDNNTISKPTKAKNAVGLDMGLTHFIITSDRVKYKNNKYFVRSQQKLKKLRKTIIQKAERKQQ